MSSLRQPLPPQTADDFLYPETDGLPIADNTLQFEWIVRIKCWVEAHFKNDPDVFVAGDLFWYPVEGDPSIRIAPDTMVVFGRPKGHRRSYLQWREEGIPPQVVFEVLSPVVTGSTMLEKRRVYSRFGVEEYYIYDPDRNVLNGHERIGDSLREIPIVSGWVSPRLKVEFRWGEESLQLFDPLGKPFATYLELVAQRDEALAARDESIQRRQRLEDRLREFGIDPGTA